MGVVTMDEDYLENVNGSDLPLWGTTAPPAAPAQWPPVPPGFPRDQISPEYTTQETARWMREQTLARVQAENEAKQRNEAAAVDLQLMRTLNDMMERAQAASQVDDQLKNVQNARKFIATRQLERDLQSGMDLATAARRNPSALSGSVLMRSLAPQPTFPAAGTTMRVPGGNLMWPGGTERGQLVRDREVSPSEPSLEASRVMSRLASGRQATQSAYNAAKDAYEDAFYRGDTAALPKLREAVVNAKTALDSFNQQVREASTNRVAATSAAAPPPPGAPEAMPAQPGEDPIARAFKEWMSKRPQ